MLSSAGKQHWLRPRHADCVATLLGAAILVTSLIGAPAVVRAQQTAYALGSAESAQALAHQAIECLHRGEDGITRDTRLKAYREGLALAQRAVQADNENADAHFALFANNGRIMLLGGATPNPLNLLEANRELERALELDPNHADALAAKGGVYRQLPRLLGGSLEKAEVCLTRSIEHDPDAVGARIELAATYRDMGQPDRGVPLLEKATEVATRVGKYRQLADARALLRELQAAH